MKAYTPIFSIAAILLLLSTRADACRCGAPTPCKAFADASAVFIGRMIGGSEKVEMENSADGKISYEAGTVRFAIEEIFKGRIGTEVRISVNSQRNTTCGPYGLIRGEKYLVYAYAYGDLAQLSTGFCTRTTLITKADDDLQYLHNLPKQGTGGRLYGTVWMYKYDGDSTGLAGIHIIVKGADNESIKAITNRQGEFEFANLKPGKYQVEPLWPEPYSSERSKQEVTISDRGCTGIEIEAKYDGRINGRVFDSSKRPAALMLHLAHTDPSHRTIDGLSDEDGAFQIFGVPPGSYLLYIELYSEGLQNNKKYYYPGSTNAKEATVIKVGLGQKLEGYDFQMPPDFAVRTVEGLVVWPDGSAAAGVEVMLLCPKSTQSDGHTLDYFGSPIVSTDDQGRFRLQGFKGIQYRLEARSNKIIPVQKTNVPMHSPTRQITLEEDLNNIKITLVEGFINEGCGQSPKQK
jgi:hypothetical protein